MKEPIRSDSFGHPNSINTKCSKKHQSSRKQFSPRGGNSFAMHFKHFNRVYLPRFKSEDGAGNGCTEPSPQENGTGCKLTGWVHLLFLFLLSSQNMAADNLVWSLDQFGSVSCRSRWDSCWTCKRVHARNIQKYESRRGFRKRTMQLWEDLSIERASQEWEASLGLHAKWRRREFRKLSYSLRGRAICLMREGTTWRPTGSKMHSISCSFYLFVLPSISSRALSSLALASYSSSMNSCCRFLPERKKSHRQSFATQRKGQIWQSIFATVQVQRPLLLEQTVLPVVFSAMVSFIQNQSACVDSRNLPRIYL